MGWQSSARYTTDVPPKQPKHVGPLSQSHAHPELSGAEYVVFVNSSRRYVDCSDGVTRLLGYERQELLQKSIDDISYHDDDVKRLFKEYLDAGRLEGEYVLMSKDRTPVPIRYRSFVFGDGGLAAIWEPVEDWRKPYMAALLEVHPDKLRQKIEIALAAIQMRQSDASLTTQERQLIQDATSALRALLRTAK
jgi:PAS domain-containing protein